MSLLIKLSSSLRKLAEGYDPHQGLTLEAQPGERVAQLLDRLGIPSEKVKIIMINGRTARLDTVVIDGDRVALFPPVGGG